MSYMGYVKVKVSGSYVTSFDIGSTDKSFSALEHGHADAVARAIEYLSTVILPQATALDHRLHDEGNIPRNGFTPHRISTNREM